MFDKDVIAIDISKESISILIGNKYKISEGVTIETPKGTFENESIVDAQGIAAAIGPHIRKAKTKDVSFIVRGQDIITRHMKMPMATDEAMRDSIDFELRQFFGDRIDEYYFDYEIMSYNKNDASGKCDVLIVACDKEKINSYIALSKILKLNIKAIDLYANTIARVISHLKPSLIKGIKTIGVINIDADDSAFVISEWGKLTIERYRNGGIMSSIGEDNFIKYNSVLDSIDLTEVKQSDEEDEIDRYFKEEVMEYNSLIQYYTSGKVRKNLDRIYVIGSAVRIRGIEQYISVNLNSRVSKAPIFADLKVGVKAPKNVALKDYFMTYGLLLRREE